MKLDLCAQPGTVTSYIACLGYEVWGYKQGMRPRGATEVDEEDGI